MAPSSYALLHNCTAAIRGIASEAPAVSDGFGVTLAVLVPCFFSPKSVWVYLKLCVPTHIQNQGRPRWSLVWEYTVNTLFQWQPPPGPRPTMAIFGASEWQNLCPSSYLILPKWSVGPATTISTMCWMFLLKLHP